MVDLAEIFGRHEATITGDLRELVIVLDEAAFALVGVELNESRWTPSAISGLFVRVDPVRPEMKQERHVHVAQKKHLRSPSEQASWNLSGDRHDRHSFNVRFGTRADVKDVARSALGLPGNFLLESATPASHLLLEGLSDDPHKPLVLVQPDPSAIARRIGAAAPPYHAAVVLDQLRQLGDTDLVLRVIDTDDERVAVAYRGRAVWGPKLSISRETFADSLSSPNPIGPSDMAQMLFDTIVSWVEEGWLR